ncbi:MAG TPA: hypothetical protein PKD12_05475 [Nitrospira sp.]|nr:hypothetical protein [Nitrospira sp.]
MRVIQSPEKSIGESLHSLWRGTPALKDQFPDDEAGTQQFIAFCAMATLQRIEKEQV